MRSPWGQRHGLYRDLGSGFSSHLVGPMTSVDEMGGTELRGRAREAVLRVLVV